MTIKLFPFMKMIHTPFEHPKGAEILRGLDVVLTSDSKEADLFLSRQWHTGLLLELVLRHRARKPVLVWAHDPRVCSVPRDRFEGPFGVPKVHFMTVFSSNIYLCNYSIYGYLIRGELPRVTLSDLADKRSRKAVALAGYRRYARWRRVLIDGVDTDLVAQRQRIVLEGCRRGIIDVYGRDWPRGVALGESQDKSWQENKAEILKGYRFNLCMENTDFDYYVTEKIWDAINARCLPIYRGSGEKIYEDFERGSFIDTKDFSDAEQVFDYIESISDAEYCARLNSCIDTYNKIWKRQDFDAQYRRTVEAIVHRIKGIIAETRDR